MTSKSCVLVAMALAAAFCLGWSAAVAQQARKPIMMTRIYTGADGLTHSERSK